MDSRALKKCSLDISEHFWDSYLKEVLRIQISKNSSLHSGCMSTQSHQGDKDNKVFKSIHFEKEIKNFKHFTIVIVFPFEKKTGVRPDYVFITKLIDFKMSYAEIYLFNLYEKYSFPVYFYFIFICFIFHIQSTNFLNKFYIYCQLKTYTSHIKIVCSRKQSTISLHKMIKTCSDLMPYTLKHLFYRNIAKFKKKILKR